ncbi:amino acid ABC transporter substrate-binding protein [Virgisporangium aliadipatigenens]|uniref:Amino acid ABC transporter substrate-binding protein n=1 Tax=Virgisporangium aliadipatigenens TaxID=741659 RepID=A0A8J3YIM9_9ACTN|nr:ABC transporter substrate-binding protein [Virgisporangium aliadipatigenens]GIJ46034.1 amino acid ABC transporter substrate-binding protein [Virgisporangium aliadipatigenens]
MRSPRLGYTLLLVVALAACAPADEPDPQASGAGCAPGGLKTLTAGKLTFGTDDPVYPPWFVENKPDNGQGFEGAVALAVATKLGYTKENVVWVRVPFNTAIAPGAKTYDIDINEFSITDERKQAVDFSAPYYDVTQAVVALKSSRVAGAKSIADLRGAKLGAQVGTTSLKAINESVQPTAAPQVYNNNDDAKQALQNGSIDGLVVDLPTAFYITSAELDNGLIVGQLPQPSGTPEQFGLVLDKGSALTACVSQAVIALRGDGTLAGLEKQWLAGVSGAPVLS